MTFKPDSAGSFLACLPFYALGVLIGTLLWPQPVVVSIRLVLCLWLGSCLCEFFKVTYHAYRQAQEFTHGH